MDFEFGPYEIFQYFVRVGIVTGSQLVRLVLPFLVLVVLLHLLARIIRKNAIQVFGWDRYLILFGWLGVAVHEIGHLIFFLLFMILVFDVKLFMRKPIRGKIYGYVLPAHLTTHSDYLKIASFFVGVGPIILGTVVIYFMGKFLLGGDALTELQFPIIDETTFVNLANIENFGRSVLNSLNIALAFFLNRQNLADWKFYVFIYIAFSIASAMSLSKSDIRIALLGIATIIITLYIVNLFTLWSGVLIQNFVSDLVEVNSAIYGVMVFVMMMNIVVAAAVLLLYGAVSTIRTALTKS
jgi:hypothetical protein